MYKQTKSVFECAQQGDILGLKKYLQDGGDPNVKDINRSEQTPLHCAKNAEVVKALIDAGAEPMLRIMTEKHRYTMHIMLKR